MAEADTAGGVGGVENGGATELHAENGKQQQQLAVAAAAITYKPVKPHLIIQAPRCLEAIAFYKAAFGAEELAKMFCPKRKADQEQPCVMHAHLRVGETDIYIADEPEEDDRKSNVKNPAVLKGSSLFLHFDTNDVDAAVLKALAAGATVGLPVADQFWGARYGSIIDPFGYAWSFSTPLSEGAGAEVPVEAAA